MIEFVLATGLVASALLAVGKLVTIVFKKIRGWWRKCDRVLDIIDYELQHNGGKSTKDAVIRIEKRVAAIEKHVGMESDE